MPMGPLKWEDFQYPILLLGPISTISYSRMDETVENESYFTEALRRDKLWIGQFQETLISLGETYLKETESTK